jgi:PAS domain S-box-containing protein
MQHRSATEPSATQSPARLLHLLAVIAAITNDVTDVDEAFCQALEEICRFAEWPIGQAYVVSGDSHPSHHLWHVDDARRFAALRAELEDVAGGEGLVQRVLATDEPSWVEDLSADPALACAEIAVAAGLRSAIGVPVRVGREVVAVLGFYSTRPIGADPDLVELLQTVGVQLVRMIERARSLELMEAEHARQRLFFEASSDAVFVADATAHITDANAAACRLLGCTVDELIGLSPAEFAAPEWADVIRQNVDAKISGEQVTSHYEYVVVDSGGNRIPVEVTSTALRDGDEVVGFHALIRDLREHRRAERALRESDERFRGAFEAAPIGMALASPEGRWLRVNEALCELIGYTAKELLTMCFQEVTHPDDLAGDVALGTRLLAGELSSYQMDKRFVRKDGTAVWAHLSVSLVRDDDGAPAYSVVQILDIDERKRRELEANKLRSRHPISGSLSPREREVLGLLAEGNTSAEVGILLGVAEETVQTHVRRSMAKLDARSRTQAVASAIRLGWLGDYHPALASII